MGLEKWSKDLGFRNFDGVVSHVLNLSLGLMQNF